MRDRIGLGFGVSIESDSFLMWGSKLTVFGPKSNCYECDHRLAWFSVGGGGGRH